MFDLKERARATLQVQEPEELLSDMKLRNPEISVMLKLTLSLRDEDISDDCVEDRYGKIYSFHLIKFERIKRCLLQVPTAISRMQCGDPRKVFGAVDMLRDSLVIKFGDDVGLFIIHDGKIDPSFMTYTTYCRKLYRKLILKYIDLETLIYLRTVKLEERRDTLRDFFEINLNPVEMDALQTKLAGLRKLLDIHRSTLEQLEIEEAKCGGINVPPRTIFAIEDTKKKISEIEAQISEIETKM